MLSILGIGFVLGLKHALDADHLLAVSTIISERKGILRSAGVGLLWGLGHTASLLLAGLIVIALRVEIPERVALTMEFLVALMLIGLGLNVLYKLVRGGKIHSHAHWHGNHLHVHPHAHEHAPGDQHVHHHEPFGFMSKSMMSHLSKDKKPVFIGMIHGLAGSAALMLVVLATIPSTGLALAYVAIFGFGSVGGMVAMSTVIGIPFALTPHRSERLNQVVRGVSGGLSLVFGSYYAWQIAVIDRLVF
ncbi:MAG: high-affinity nickel-transporter [Bacteroidetes bacterium]|nr:high-affinity nickel-transporter [Bacteroidota bacterium]